MSRSKNGMCKCGAPRQIYSTGAMSKTCRPCKIKRNSTEGEISRRAGAKYRANNAERVRGFRIFNMYGITAAQERTLFDQQEGLCATCSASMCLCSVKGRLKCPARAHIEHDHRANKVRGLVCHRCNMGIGLLRDSATIARNVALYLETPLRCL